LGYGVLVVFDGLLVIHLFLAGKVKEISAWKPGGLACIMDRASEMVMPATMVIARNNYDSDSERRDLMQMMMMMMMMMTKCCDYRASTYAWLEYS